MVALDDCGVRINPMIVEGQIHGGLTEGLREVVDAVDHLRRGRQLHRLELHGLPDPDRVGDAEVRAARDVRAVAAPPDRRQGRRRVGHRRLAGRVRQRGDRRARAPRRAQHRHAAAARPRVVGDPVRGGPSGADGRRACSPRRWRWRGRGGAFVLATVVWRRAPTSGQVGSKAIVLARRDGAGLARRRVRRADGGPRGAGARWPTAGRGCCSSARPTSSPRHERDGMVTIPMACESEGALEVYIEPFLPAPQLVVVGRSPAVHALDDPGARARVGRRGDRRRRRRRPSTRIPSSCAPRSTSTGSASARRRRSSSRRRATTTTSRCERALATDAGYIGVVAAEKRASALARARCATEASTTSSCRRRARARRARPRRGRPTPRSRSRCSPTSSRGARPAHSVRSSTPHGPREAATRCAA